MRLCKLFHTLGAVFSVVAVTAGAKCPSNVLKPLPFVLDYAVWRGWRQTVIYTLELDPVCHWTIVRLVKCLGVNGIATAMDIKYQPNLATNLGVILLLPMLGSNLTEKFENKMKKLQNFGMNAACFDWLIVARSYHDFKYVNKVLNDTAIRFDENIVVAYQDYREKYGNGVLGLCDENFIYNTRGKTSKGTTRISNNASYYERSYYHSSERFKSLKLNSTYRSGNTTKSLFASGSLNYNYSRPFHMVNVSRLKEDVSYLIRSKFKNRNTHNMYLFQYFKIRINSTLYGSFLGIWNREFSMSLVAPPYPVEARKFMGEELVFGRCNSTKDCIGLSEEDVPQSPASLDDVLNFLTVRFNASSSMRYYNKLGFRTYEGAWTGMLGALIDNNIDVALELVTSHSSQHQDIDFIFPIAETMFNIYIHDQETSAVRDIFLAPFSLRLLGCVFANTVAFAIAILLISKLSPSSNVWSMALPEAFLWSIGIMCQQGGSSTPLNPSARVLLIICLLFALVTYNSYAAFITSVLSVRVASVDTVAAVLASPDLKIGYIKNGPDQMYLMSTKDAQLNAFYIRGYSDAENLVTSAEEGLIRAAKYDYAFFSEQRSARTTLRSFSQARGRCSLRELAVPSTRAHLAFPLPRGSPYARPVLVSLLQLRGAGVLARLEDMLVPEMPKCAPSPRFASARATDVRSALILFLIGLISAILIGVAEYLWNKRCQLQKSINRYYTCFQNGFD